MIKTNFILYIFQYFVKFISLLLLNILILKVYGIEKYGIYSYTIALFSFSAFFLTLGMDEIIIRDIIYKKFSIDEIMGSSLFIKAIGFIFMILSIFLLSRYLPLDNNYINILKMVFFSFIFQIFSNIDLFFKSQLNYKIAVLSLIVPQIITIILSLYVLISRIDILYIYYIIIFENILIAIFRILFYFHQGLNIRTWIFSFKTFKSLIRDSFPIAINSAFILLFLKLDQIMLKSYLTFKEVGEYSLVVKLSEGWFFIPMSIVGSYSPVLFRSYKNNYASFINKLQVLFDILISISFAAIVFFILFGKLLLLYVFKLTDIFIYYTLCVHLFSGLFVSFSLVWTRWVITENKQFANIFNQLVALVVNIILNLILIPKYGILGAAISTLFGVAFGLSVGIYLFQKKQSLIFIKNIFSISIFKRLSILFINRNELFK